MPFRNLFAKELRSILPLYAVFAIAVLALHGFVWYKRLAWIEDTIFVVSLVIPLMFAAVLSVGTGYFQLHTEWRTNSIYLLLSLPVRGWKVLTAKLAALLSLLVATVAWIGVSFALILLRERWGQLTASGEFTEFLPEMIRIVANTFWICLLGMTFLLVLIQFAYLCGQLVAKFKWLVVLTAFLGGVWLMLRISPMLSGLLLWMPDVFLGEAGDEDAYLQSGPFLVLALLTVGLGWLNGYIFEREVEV